MAQQRITHLGPMRLELEPCARVISTTQRRRVEVELEQIDGPPRAVALPAQLGRRGARAGDHQLARRDLRAPPAPRAEFARLAAKTGAHPHDDVMHVAPWLQTP